MGRTVSGGLLDRQTATAFINVPAVRPATRGGILGHALLINSVHTESDPFMVTADEPFNFPLRFDSGRVQDATPEILQLINNDDSSLVALADGNAFGFRLEFMMITPLSDRKGRSKFKVAGTSDFNYERFEGAPEADVAEPVTMPMTFFQGANFLANGGVMECVINGAAKIYNVKLYIEHKYRGSNI